LFREGNVGEESAAKEMCVKRLAELGTVMGKHYSLVVLILAFTLNAAWGQDNSTPPTSDAPQDTSQQPTPAYGQDNAPTPVTENPPLSGLDMPGLEPHAAPLSYLQPGVVVTESADTNVADTLGQSGVRSVTEALGSLTLQRLWSHYALALDYLGGAAYYNAHGIGWKLLQEMDFEQKVMWKRGQLAVRDSFSYLPEGNFGAEYGALGTTGITSVGASTFGPGWGQTTLGALGEVPRISNLAIADISENLSPKSAVTGAVGYAFTHFTGNPALGSVPLVNDTFLGSSQVSAQGGYNRILNPHDQIALVYGYEGFDFSAQGTAFHSHVVEGMYGHRISGRLDFLIGAGPQITHLDFAGVTDTRIGVAGQAHLRYRFPKTMMEIFFARYETSGSGFFAGAESNVVQARFSRPITRRWSGFVDLGYSHNSRIQPTVTSAVIANTFDYGFAGVGVRRAFSRKFVLFGTYQFNEVSFDGSFCQAQGVGTCSRIAQRHLVTIGLQWIPRPIRID
jgi:hypothetical protein